MKVDTVAKQMLYSTTRLTNVSSGGTSRGTGFFFDATRTEGNQIPLIVTNKHVLKGAKTLVVEMVQWDGVEDEPGQSRVSVSVSDPQWVGHPDPKVDVAALSAVAITGATKPFYRILSSDTFPTKDDEDHFDAIEELTFVGYPNGWMDEVNNTPIIRRAITASPLSQNFDGEPAFLLDGSVFGGSSGSPVFLYNGGGTYMHKGVTRIGQRCLLVGVVAATKVRQQILPLEVATAPHTRIAQELNLGVAYSWKSIDEVAEAFCLEHGVSR